MILAIIVWRGRRVSGNEEILLFIFVGFCVRVFLELGRDVSRLTVFRDWRDAVEKAETRKIQERMMSVIVHARYGQGA